MSNTLRVCFWGIVALLLAAVLAVGLFSGNGLADLNLGNLLPSFTLFSGHRYEGAEDYAAGGASLPAANISAVEINWVAGHVNIRFTDTDQITFSETAKRNFDDSERLHYRVRDGKLTIQFCKSQWKLFASLPDKALEIALPRSMSLASLRVETVSADVAAGGAAGLLDALAVETVSGQVACEGLSGRRLNAQSVSGTLAFAGAFEAVKANTVSGEIALRFYDMPRQVNAESVSGNVKLALPENKGFTVKFDSVSGRLRCSFADLSSRGKTVYGDGSSQITLQTVSGSAVIDLDESLSRDGNAAVAAPEMAGETNRQEQAAPSSGRKF